MRNLSKNKQNFSYLNYKGRRKVVDNEGNYTGEEEIIYSKPCPYKAQISSTIGQSQVEIFGTDISYDKTILITKSEFKQMGLDENSVFFIDNPIKYEGIIPLYDYEVKKIAPSPNFVLIAVKRVR